MYGLNSICGSNHSAIFSLPASILPVAGIICKSPHAPTGEEIRKLKIDSWRITLYTKNGSMRSPEWNLTCSVNGIGYR